MDDASATTSETTKPAAAKAPRGVPQNWPDAAAALSRRVSKLEASRLRLTMTTAGLALVVAFVGLGLWSVLRSLWSRVFARKETAK